MSKAKSFRIVLICLMTAVFLLASAMMGMRNSYADTHKPVSAGDFEFNVYFDDDGNTTSVLVSGYKGSDTSITLPTNLIYNGKNLTVDGIDMGAFNGNGVITKVIIPNGYGGISPGAFYGCPELTEVVIGDTVQFIGDNAFSNCPKLKTYKFGIAQGSYLSEGGYGADSAGILYDGVVAYVKPESKIKTELEAINQRSIEISEHKYIIDIRTINDPAPEANVKVTVKADTEPDPTPTPVIKPAKDVKPGQKAEAVKKYLIKYSSESDPKGSSFNLLQAKTTKITKSSIKISYKKPSGTKKFMIFANKCGSKNKLKYLKTVTARSFTQKKLRKGKYYKYLVVAVNSKGKVVSTSKVIHAATKGGKVGNDKKVKTKAKKNRVTLKKGKTFSLKAKAVPASKKLKVKRHRKIKYESSKTSIATVSSKGVIKAKRKGTCYVYAYAQNGFAAKVKVTVK